MTQPLLRALLLASLLPSSLLLSACDNSNTSQGALYDECLSAEDCPEGLGCIELTISWRDENDVITSQATRGVCTIGCVQGSDACLPNEFQETGTCVLGSDLSAWCLETCLTDFDCDENFACSSGACLPYTNP